MVFSLDLRESFLMSYAGLTRVSIFFGSTMDYRVKPGNDDWT